VGHIGILGRKLKGAGERERPGSFFNGRSEVRLAVSLDLEGSSTGQLMIVIRNQGVSQESTQKKAPGGRSTRGLERKPGPNLCKALIFD